MRRPSVRFPAAAVFAGVASLYVCVQQTVRWPFRPEAEWHQVAAHILSTAWPFALGVGGVALLAAPWMARAASRSWPYLRGVAVGLAVALCGTVLSAPLIGYVSVGPSLRDTAQMVMLIVLASPYIAIVVGPVAGSTFTWWRRRTLDDADSDSHEAGARIG